jgi:hypothetical protein
MNVTWVFVAGSVLLALTAAIAVSIIRIRIRRWADGMIRAFGLQRECLAGRQPAKNSGRRRRTTSVRQTECELVSSVD